MRENKYQAIVLKKQAFGEADEIITFFSKEQGKVRALAKSIRLSKSKLQNSLQQFFLVNLRLVSSGSLAKIVGSDIAETFLGLREAPEKTYVAFFVAEIILKFFPDENPSPKMFELVVDFFCCLSRADFPKTHIFPACAKFEIEALKVLGLSVKTPLLKEDGKPLFFSCSQGGFTYNQDIDSEPVSVEVLKNFENLEALPHLNSVANLENLKEYGVLEKQLKRFLEYHLEMSLKSHRFVV